MKNPPRPEKHAPGQAHLQWRWVVTKNRVEKSLWRENVTATTAAATHAHDHYCKLGFIHGTGTTSDPDKITKADVEAYLKAGKPENEVSEERLPNIFETISEMNDASMHVVQYMKWDQLPIYQYGRFEEIDGVRTPVIIMEWTVRPHRKSRLARLHERDPRFGVLAARADNPWRKCWGVGW